jgi:16S rRNA (guanine527-N7)-methyltransferase
MTLKVNKFLTAPIVSRETMTDFKIYYDMLFDWNQSISLMKLSDWEDFYNRHILDSIQMSEIIDRNLKVIDFGSGGGIPGIPLSIIGFNVIMIESILKKVTFLKQVVNKLQLSAHVISNRIENTKLEESVTITARALTSLTNLFSYMENVSRETIGVFLKGRTLEMEIKEAQKDWLFDFEIYNSITGDGYIIKIKNLSRKGI